MPRYIDADVLLHKLRKSSVRNAATVIDIVESQPLADVQEVKHGRWVNDTYCSVCSRFPVDTSESISNCRLTKFFERCPHCGAKMERGESDD